MSTYMAKYLSGETANAADWNMHLIEAHKKAPGMTPLAFADCRNAFGSTSYEWLMEAATVQPDPQEILDLACGDGYLTALLSRRYPQAQLTGIDMSASELSLAAERQFSERVRFRCATADKTDLPAQSVDIIFCHMAFMLMTPLEPVMAEIKRVLRPNGLFAAVIGGEPPPTSFHVQFRQTVKEVLDEVFPGRSRVMPGDARLNSEAGTRDIFRGFSSVMVSDDLFGKEEQPDSYWERVRHMYHIASLPPGALDRLRTKVLNRCEEHRQRTGSLVFDFPFRRILAIH